MQGPSGGNQKKDLDIPEDGEGFLKTMITELSDVSRRQPSEKCCVRGVGKGIPGPGNGMDKALKASKNEVSSGNS